MVQPYENRRIFVLIASYRDPECEKTVRELFDKAADPSNLSVGILWQYSPEDPFRSYDPAHPNSGQIRCREVHYKQSRGVCWARNIAQGFLEDEAYVLIIDSHMLFETGWDRYLIEELAACPSDKALLSHYPPGYDLPDIKSDMPPMTNAAHNRRNRFAVRHPHPYNIRGNIFQFKRGIGLNSPIRSLFYAAGFAFGPSDFLREVPYDALLDWEEEEIAIALKLWTHGWDIYAPRKHCIFHLYHDKKPSETTPYFRKALSRDQLARRDAISKKRFYHLLGLEPTDDPEALEEIDRYALGRVRSVRSFEMAAGVTFETRSVTERAVDCWFALDTAAHPLRFETSGTLRTLFEGVYRTAKAHHLSGSLSGSGSSLEITTQLRGALSELIATYAIRSLADLGCGDGVWMKEVTASSGLIRYTGIDIVPELIAIRRDAESDPRCRYETGDITVDPFDVHDLVVVRDLFTHFKIRNVIKALSVIKNSGSTYLLVSHYTRADRSRDLLKDGRWHPVNLTIPPFGLPEPLAIINDIPSKHKYLALWRVDQIPDLSYRAAELILHPAKAQGIVRRFLSRDESEYLASLPLFRKHTPATGTLELPIDDTNPIVRRVIERFEHFAARVSAMRIITVPGDARRQPNIFKPPGAKMMVTLLDHAERYAHIARDTYGTDVTLHVGDGLLLDDAAPCNYSLQPRTSGTAIFLLQTAHTEERSVETANQHNFPNRGTITFSGDLILSRRMHRFYHSGHASQMLGSLFDLYQRSEINVCNLETVISNRGSPQKKGEHNPYYFRASTALGAFLVEAKINAVTTGNNHAMDFGAIALHDQERFLSRHGITHCGSGQTIDAARRPAYLDINGTVIALISFSCVRPKTLGATATSAGVFEIADVEEIADTLAPIIAACKRSAHLVVVSPHWIENWVTEPSPALRTQARRLIDLGCDAIFGHSSHLLHGIEVYRNRPIVYDMGSILMDNISGHADLKYSAVFELSLQGHQLHRLIVHPVVLGGGSVSAAEGTDAERIIGRLYALNGLGAARCNLHMGKLTVAFEPQKAGSPVIGSAHARGGSSDDDDAPFPNAALPDPSLYPRHNFEPLHFENGYALIGVECVEACHVRAGFALKTVIRTGPPFDRECDIHLHGVSRCYGERFDEYHLVAGGRVDERQWHAGTVVIDDHFVRLPRHVKAGVYDLFFGFTAPDHRPCLRTAESAPMAHIATLYILPGGIDTHASGIDWDGRLPHPLRERFEREFITEPETFLMREIQRVLEAEKAETPTSFAVEAISQKYGYLPKRSIVYITLSADTGTVSLRWGSIRNDLARSLRRDIEILRTHPRFAAWEKAEERRIDVEIVTEEREIETIDETSAGTAQGLKVVAGKASYLLLPSECVQQRLRSTGEKMACLLRRHGVLETMQRQHLFLLSSVRISEAAGSVWVERYGRTTEG